MKSPSLDDLAIQSAVLPFVVSWKDIDDDAKVLSLDTHQRGWDVLLTGQGIKLQTDKETRADQWSVITQFDACNVVSLDDLKAWASGHLRSLKPGGFLIVGGTLPSQTEVKFDLSYPETVTRILQDAGFVRARAISPSLDPGNKTLHSALYETSRKFAIIAQKHAVGKSFDIFSPSFLRLLELTPQTRFRHAEDELHVRIHKGETKLHERINHVDRGLLERTTALQVKTDALENFVNEHVRKSHVVLERQADEIEQLRTEVEALKVKLKRATRRRGLRKLAYDLRKKLRPKPEEATPTEIIPQVPPPQKPEAFVQEVRSKPDPAQPTAPPTLAPVDPIPLSSNELAMRLRLFDDRET